MNNINTWLIVTLAVMIATNDCFILVPKNFEENDMIYVLKRSDNPSLKRKLNKKSAAFDRLKYSGSWIRIGKRSKYAIDTLKNKYANNMDDFYLL